MANVEVTAEAYRKECGTQGFLVMVLTHSISWLGAAFWFEFSLAAPGDFPLLRWRGSRLRSASCCHVLYGETATSPIPLSFCDLLGKMCMPTSSDGIIWGSFAGVITQAGKEQTFMREMVNFLPETPPYFQAIIPQPSLVLKWGSRFLENLNNHIRPDTTAELNSLERASL